MICCAEQQSTLTRPAEGTSGLHPICATTSAGCFIGENVMKKLLYHQTEKAKAANRKAVSRYRKTKKGRISHLKSSLRYHIRHPEGRKARDAVRGAILVGKIPRINTKQCYYCNLQAKYYHHNSYEPEHQLDVIPVCIECHIKIHTRKEMN